MGNFFLQFLIILMSVYLTGSDNADELTRVDPEVTTKRISIRNSALSDISPFFIFRLSIVICTFGRDYPLVWS